jgi:ABC-2 type transport system permease protein
VTFWQAVRLVAMREMSTRSRERSFLLGSAVSVIIILLVAVVPPLLGLGGTQGYTVVATDAQGLAVAQAAARTDEAFDARVTVRRMDPAAAARALEAGDADAVLTGGTLRAKDDPPDTLANLLQAANRDVRTAQALRAAGVSGDVLRQALAPPPLRVTTTTPADEDRARRGGLAFIAVLALFGQIIAYGNFVAMGIVEEKSSRVVEVVLSTIRPRALLAGKVLGLGVLGFAQLLLTAILGLIAAQAAGALEIDGDVIAAVLLAVVWFVVGYAFYACLYATAATLVPRQEELQSVMTPLTIVLLVSYFVSFGAVNDPDGTLARVASFIPFTAPMTMPPRIALGAASASEIVAAFVITLAAAAALIPLAGRIYSGAILRTGQAVKRREAWRAARA